MKVLVIGRGGREHALAWKLKEDGCDVFVAPGNANMADVATSVAVEETDVAGLIAFAREQGIAWTIVGPESALMAGVVDGFTEAGLNIFGPTKAAALLEGSKAFAKEVMSAASIPTARYEVFRDADSAIAYVREVGVPIVVKADGLAAGKGVLVAFDIEEAVETLHDIFDTTKYGAQSQVVIEEFLEGEEFSLMAFVSGNTVIPMITSQDHKRAYDGDRGPNTGGMGAYSPMPHLPQAVLDAAIERVLHPLAEEMVRRGTPFEGFLYAGLISTEQGPKVIEFNARFGDPETEVILPNLVTPLLTVIEAVKQQQVIEVAWANHVTVGVVVASEGYPGTAERGQTLAGFDKLDETIRVFHAGTDVVDGRVVATGGRLFVVTASKETVEEAREAVYEAIARLELPHTFHRTDIGYRALTHAR